MSLASLCNLPGTCKVLRQGTVLGDHVLHHMLLLALNPPAVVFMAPPNP